MILDEGRNREIRRLLARIGHKVQRLTRIAVGPVRLGDLPSGAVRLLTKQEIAALRERRSPKARRKRPSAKPAHTQLHQAAGEEEVNHRGHGEHGEKARSVIGGG